nr:MAG TPA: zinc-ribbon containing domain protein [Caudoviricetes sp.]DAG32351.1 MAG TPA: zinc-ribbon containing domain protein [Caudoviricetes sp.]
MALQPCPHCGHPISEKAEKCPVCGQNPHLTPEELDQQNEAKKKKRKRTLLIVGICAAVVLVAAGICAALYLPDYLDYRAACDLLDQKNYVAAVAAFDELGDYRDSAQQALEARYQHVVAHKTRDNQQTRDYIQELVDEKYKDAADIEKEIYAWHITVKSCGSKNGAWERTTFRIGDPLFFYVEVHGGHIGESCRLRYEATIYPTMYWQGQGVPKSTQKDDMGTFKDGGTYWFGWENGIQTDVIGSIAFTLYDADTNESIASCNIYMQ